MASGAPIFAMDLGIKTGVAVGLPGAVPRSFTWVLKQPHEEREIAFANLIAWLDTQFRESRPRFVIKEQPFALGAFTKRGNSGATVRLTYGLHAVVEGVCRRFAIPCFERHDQTIRKHFIGRARGGDRKLIKAAVLRQCRLLDYLDADCNDDNRADALAAWDFASAVIANVPPRRLHLFGEAA
jgi:hypothetical protein